MAAWGIGETRNQRILGSTVVAFLLLENTHSSIVAKLRGDGLSFAAVSHTVMSIISLSPGKEPEMRRSHFIWKRGAATAVGALLLTMVGCSQPLSTREKSTLAGGGLGAATGAIVGATVGAPGAGAAIGGALGAGAGALVGDQAQSRDQELAEQEHELAVQQREIQQQRYEIERERQRRE